MPPNDGTGRPEELTSAKLVRDTRVLRGESERLIQNSTRLLDRSWQVLARVLMRYIDAQL